MATRRKLTVPVLELILGGIGAVVVLALAGYFTYAALSGRGRGQPEIAVMLAPAQRQSTGWLVPFVAVNRGDGPASQLTVEAVLRPPSGEPLRSQTVIDFLGSHAESEGGFFFGVDPASGQLSAGALAFTRP